MKTTAQDEAEELRRRSQEWFNRYVITGTISEEELLNIPDPTETPKQPFTREP